MLVTFTMPMRGQPSVISSRMMAFQLRQSLLNRGSVIISLSRACSVTDQAITSPGSRTFTTGPSSRSLAASP